MIGGLIVGHRNIGESILTALESIAGYHEYMAYVSNEGLSTREMRDQILETASEMNVGNLILFVDVYGGSCWQAAKMAKSDNDCIVTGVNLPMILSFVHKRDLFPVDELANVLENDGKRGIKTE